jgi:hypothetical protein
VDVTLSLAHGTQRKTPTLSRPGDSGDMYYRSRALLDVNELLLSIYTLFNWKSSREVLGTLLDILLPLLRDCEGLALSTPSRRHIISMFQRFGHVSTTRGSPRHPRGWRSKSAKITVDQMTAARSDLPLLFANMRPHLFTDVSLLSPFLH